jgi:hypothetical protein
MRLPLLPLFFLAACGSPPSSTAPTSDPHARALAATTAPRLIAPASGTTLPPGCYLSAQVVNEGGDADVTLDPPTLGASIVWDGMHPCVRWYPQPGQVDAGLVSFTIVGTNPAGTSVVRFTAAATSATAGFPNLPKAKG